MKDLTEFFKAVAADYPTVEHGGMSFKVRKAAMDDRQNAIARCRADQEIVVKSLENPDEVLTSEQITAYVKFASSGDESTKRLFGIDDVKTRADVERCIFRITYHESYVLAMTLMFDDGSSIDNADLFNMAKIIQTTPKFKAKIVQALKTFEIPAESPNGSAL